MRWWGGSNYCRRGNKKLFHRISCSEPPGQEEASSDHKTKSKLVTSGLGDRTRAEPTNHLNDVTHFISVVIATFSRQGAFF